MKKIIEKITPVFIKRYNDHLLKNAPLGWQLQLPTITWIWFLITVVTLPLPFLYILDTTGDDDIEGVILISVLTAVLEGGLFVYILIQFNNLKSFGKRVFANGFKEQFAYLYVFMLCMLHIIFYPLIIDVRKGNLMTRDEIINEAVTYNKAVHYFMGYESQYRYFPSDASFLRYTYFQYAPAANENESDGEYIDQKEVYYIEQIKPLLKPYFMADTELVDEKFTRADIKCPKLYLTGTDNYINEYHSDKGGDTSAYETYQLVVKSDPERIAAIKKLIAIYRKYCASNDVVYFDSPEQILQKYKTNHFHPVVFTLDETSRRNAPQVELVDGEEVVRDYATQLEEYTVENVHNTIMSAKNNKWKDMLERLLVCFFVALSLSVVLFLFKNVRLKEFILLFVYSGLMILVVAIVDVVLFRGREDLPIHAAMLVFFIGIYFSFLDRRPAYLSSVKTVFILLSNAAFAFMPIFLFAYFHEYHNIGKIEYADFYYDDYCRYHEDVCDYYYYMSKVIGYSCLAGGVALYIFVGSTWYKKVYERLWALPFKK